MKYKLESGDNIRTQEIFNSQSFSEILPYAEGYKLIAIDEVQQIKNIGMGLKILVGNLPDLLVISASRRTTYRKEKNNYSLSVFSAGASFSL